MFTVFLENVAGQVLLARIVLLCLTFQSFSLLPSISSLHLYKFNVGELCKVHMPLVKSIMLGSWVQSAVLMFTSEHPTLAKMCANFTGRELTNTGETSPTCQSSQGLGMDCAPGSSFTSHPWNYFHSSTPFQPVAGAQLNLAKAPKGQGMAQHLGSKKWQGTRMRLCELFSNFSSSRVWSVTHCLRMTLTSIGTMMFAK